jgi:hypothetical protein
VSVIVLGFSVVLISVITFEDMVRVLGKMNNDIHKHKEDEE